MSVPKIWHTSNSRHQSLSVRDSRDTSRLPTIPTSPSATKLRTRSKPSRWAAVYWTTILHGVAYFWQIKVDLTNQVGRAVVTLVGWQHLIFDQPYHLHLTDTQTACGLMEDQLATFGAFS